MSTATVGAGNPTRKSLATRQRLLDAAARTFRDKGYAGARLSDIADLAGLRTPGIYYYFPSKEDLVEEVLRVGVQRTSAYVREQVAAVPGDRPALDRLRAAIEAHLLMVLEIGDYTSANIRIFGQVPDAIRRRHLADQRAYGAFWRGLLDAARSAGELRPDLDPSVARMLILGALNWAAEWYRPGGHSPEDIARQAMVMVCEGLSPRRVGAGPEGR